MKNQKIGLLIPAYNEFANLEIILPKVNSCLKKYFKDYETYTLVVDKVIMDLNTKDLCNKNKTVYINRKPSNSFGDAIRTGIKYYSKSNLRPDWLIIMDADGSHDPEFFKFFEKELTNNTGVLIASRYINGGDSSNNLILKLMSKFVNFIYRVTFNLPIKDVSNNYKLYDFNKLNSLKLVENNFEIVEEIIIKLINSDKDLLIKELPFYFNERLHGKSKRNLITFSLTYLNSILRLKRNT